jgi:hypothetical protein
MMYLLKKGQPLLMDVLPKDRLYYCVSRVMATPVSASVPEPDYGLRVEFISPEGRVITSIPNTGFYPIVRALLQGRFDYVPVGLLCVEHLRFFTGDTLREMFEESGFRVVRLERQAAVLPPHYSEEIERLARTIPSLDEDCLSAPGYYVVATPSDLFT